MKLDFSDNVYYIMYCKKRESLPLYYFTMIVLGFQRATIGVRYYMMALFVCMIQQRVPRFPTFISMHVLRNLVN